MGYDVYITRAENWVDAEEEQPITLEAWLAYAQSDPEMRVDDRAEARTPDGEVIAFNSAGLAVWTAYSKDGQGGNHAWFDLQGGCVVVKNPDAEILRKMSRVATHFNARVQGDEGEEYGPDGSRIHDSPVDNRNPIGDGPKRAWWRRLFGG